MVAANEERPTSLNMQRTMEIDAPLEIAFEAVLEQIGPGCEFQDGTPMPMKLEPWPGGRWFRDLGDNTGHWWGTVQVIKPPKLIELCGPMFMSYPALAHVQYRLTPRGRQTMLEFCFRAMGELDPEHCRGVVGGWGHQLERIVARATARK